MDATNVTNIENVTSIENVANVTNVAKAVRKISDKFPSLLTSKRDAHRVTRQVARQVTHRAMHRSARRVTRRTVRLLVCAVTLTVFFAGFASCGTRVGRGDPFAVFRCGFEAGVSVRYATLDAEAVLTFGAGESYDAQNANDGVRLEFTSPATLSGFKMTLCDGVPSLSFGGIVSPVPVEKAGLILAVSDALSPDSGTITAIAANDDDTVSVSLGNGYVYLFGTDGKPVSVSGIYAGKTFFIAFDGFGVR